MSVAEDSLTTGIAALDHRLGGLQIGDNVLWYDAAGSLAPPFSVHFVKASQACRKAVIYVSFDRSPKTLIEDLGPLADSPLLTILDCFTDGKGEGSALFNRFYAREARRPGCRVVKVTAPEKPACVIQAVYDVHQALTGDVRLVFETLTGMQELWGGEAQVLRFYSRACPRLYELDTIAYWIIEREAHTPRLRANINKIAQVVVDLTIKRGKSTLTIVKAQRRKTHQPNKPVLFWFEGDTVHFESEQQTSGQLNLAVRLKALRQDRGLSQKALARAIGVTPSTISQIESNLIYPSLPALVKMAEILGADVSTFFENGTPTARPMVFKGGTETIVSDDLPRGRIAVERLLPTDFKAGAEVFLVTIEARQTIDRHFFSHKGEEMGYLLSGRLEVDLRGRAHTLNVGDLVYLKADTPAHWKNPGHAPARLLWLKLNP
jgi:transcriptional regulator with XRE-family HTH domain/KaiC/GvpD/RAD55 family RecA-like ATPase